MVEILERDLFIWEAYKKRCVVHPLKFAVCLHEEPPKSLNPNWLKEPLTRFPLCNDCHEQVHRMSRADAEAFLKKHRELNFPDATGVILAHLNFPSV